MTPPDVVILGGGTAGWMAACLIAKAWPQASITLVESPDIGIVGVGEGSTPQLRAFFRSLGIAEAEWMPACNATYKTGIAFAGWSGAPGHTRYFHPFASEIDGHTEPQFHLNARLRRSGEDVAAHPDSFFLNSWLGLGRKAPIASDNFPFDASYGYHFDAHLVGAFLRKHAVKRGVRHLERRIVKIAISPEGNVTHLVAEAGEQIAGAVFIDSSGFRAAIAEGALKVRHLSFASNLFNDRAVVMPTPSDPTGTDPFTTATALDNGWAWRIPLTSRIGNGYVYSTRYTTPDAAETELRAHVGVGEEVQARHLQMKVGRLETSWTGNCLAVGLSQGFIEPLEATALHIVQATVEGFIAAYQDGGFTHRHRAAFNAAIARRYDGIRDYIVLHYRLNRRTDTRYWRDNAANDALSDSLRAMMSCWFTGGDIVDEVERQGIGNYYAPLSWGCMFAGYGAFPDTAKLRPAPDRVDLPRIADIIARSGLNFEDHDAVLARMNQTRRAA